MVTLWLALALYTQPSEALPPGRAAFEKASRLFKTGAYSEALPLFQSAYRLSNRRPSTIFGLAQCHRALGHIGEAIFHFEEFIRVVTNDQAAPARRALESIRRAHPEPARRRIKPPSDPPTPAALDQRTGPVSGVDLGAVPDPPPGLPAAEGTDPILTITSETPPDEAGSFWTHPATWITAGAVIIAGAATAGWLLTRERELDGGTSGFVFEP